MIENQVLDAPPLETASSKITAKEPIASHFPFAAAVFLSAFLLFQVQLIIGKCLLPLFGGAPSVWNTCMLCFQVLLLLGYAYAHFLSSRLRPRAQARVHAVVLLASLILLFFLWLRWKAPLTPTLNWVPDPGANPVWKVLQLLAMSVAVPFFLLSTTGPLLQSWFARAYEGTSPYRLYALSNAGSLLGLLSYPFFLEWVFTLKHQVHIWSTAYVFFIAVTLGLTMRLQSVAAEAPEAKESARPPLNAQPLPGASDEAPTYAVSIMWVALSACSSIILLAATNLLCQDLAVIPLFWVLPLSLYLLSFILTFGKRGWYRRSAAWPLYFLLVGLASTPKSLSYHTNNLMQIAIYCVALLMVCMICHGELAHSKPGPSRLTSFYFLIALGGALGGIFVVLVAPAIFSGFWEFQVALIGCGLLIFLAFILQDPSGRSERSAWIAGVIVLLAFLVPHLVPLFPEVKALAFLKNEFYTGSVALAFFLVAKLVLRRRKNVSAAIGAAGFPWQPVAALALLGMFAIVAYAHVMIGARDVLHYERNFFGVKYVVDDVDFVALVSGGTLHGVESKDPSKRNVPTTYYQRESGIGLLLSNYPRGESGQDSLRVGTIGLGVGTISTYGRAGDYFRFYEIDPAVLKFSTGPHPYFHFLNDSRARIQVVLGDARLSLEQEARQGNLQMFDVLAIDAFSSDSVPVHLLTSEAMGTYLRHVRPGTGVLAFHITNRFLDLAPVVMALCNSYHLSAVQVNDRHSLWILLFQTPSSLRLPHLVDKATPVILKRQPLLWTDDYSNLVAVLKPYSDLSR